MNAELRKLSDGPEVYQMVLEIGPGENGFVNGLLSDNYSDFKLLVKRYIAMSDGFNLAPQHVPQTTYLLYVHGYPVGYGKVRHCLNENLKKHGGHIGYVIRPSCRGKGFGKLMLKKLLSEAAALGIQDVLLTCDEDNLASKRIIESNRGILSSIDEGNCKYWIKL